jgi:hypothetical protein
MVSLEFFIDIILPAALALRSTYTITRNECQKYFLEVKAAGAQA